MTDYTELREEFVRLCTLDSETKDRRRREYNQALFFPADNSIWSGCSIWSSIDLDMVLEKFDKAVKNINRKKEA